MALTAIANSIGFFAGSAIGGGVSYNAAFLIGGAFITLVLIVYWASCGLGQMVGNAQQPVSTGGLYDPEIKDVSFTKQGPEDDVEMSDLDVARKTSDSAHLNRGPLSRHSTNT